MLRRNWRGKCNVYARKKYAYECNIDIRTVNRHWAGLLRKGACDAILGIVRKAGGSFPKEMEEAVEIISKTGGTPLAVCVDEKPAGMIELQDIIKPGITARFDRIRKMGVKTVTVTGDNPLTAAYIAKEAHVDNFIAEARPEDKMEYIRCEKSSGRLVAMMGDGTNDAPALSQADVGVSRKSSRPAAEILKPSRFTEKLWVRRTSGRLFLRKDISGAARRL